MAITSIKRDWGDGLSIVRIVATDTFDTIFTDNYLTSQKSVIYALNSGDFDFFGTDYVLVDYSGGWTFASLSSDFGTLIAPPSGSGNISGMGAANQIAIFSASHTIGGSDNLTFDGTNFGVTGNANVSGNVRARALINTALTADQSYAQYVVSTGFSQTLNGANKTNIFIADPEITISTGTITLPPTSQLIDGQQIWITSTQTISALTLLPNSSQGIFGAPTTLQLGNAIGLQFVLAYGGWFPINSNNSNQDTSSLNFVDFAEYGVIYNNSGIDNTAAVQSAINANQGSNGRTLCVSGSIYLNSTTVITITDAIKILGTVPWSWESLFTGFIQQHASFPKIFSITANNSVQFTGIAFSYSTQATSGTCVQFTPSSSGVCWHPIIDNCYFRNAYNGVLMNDCVTPTITNSIFGGQQSGALSGSFNIGIVGINHADNGDGSINNCAIFMADVGIYQESNGGMRIINNKIISNNVGYALNVNGATSDLFITGNSFEGGSVGVELTAVASNSFLSAVVTGNEFGVGDIAIKVNPNGTNSIWLYGLVITGNYIAIAGTGSPQGAINLAGTFGGSIVGNNFFANGSGNCKFLNITAECSSITYVNESFVQGGVTLLPDTIANTDGSVHPIITGYNSQAVAPFSTALGYYAKANFQGSMVLSDSSSTTVTDAAPNQYVANFTGGHYLNGGSTFINAPAFLKSLFITQGYTGVAAPNAGSIVLTAYLTLLLPSAGIATFGVTLPPGPVDGQQCWFNTIFDIGVLTVSPSAGQTLYGGGDLTLKVGNSMGYIYIAPFTAWLPIGCNNPGVDTQIGQPLTINANNNANAQTITPNTTTNVSWPTLTNNISSYITVTSASFPNDSFTNTSSHTLSLLVIANVTDTTGVLFNPTDVTQVGLSIFVFTNSFAGIKGKGAGGWGLNAAALTSTIVTLAPGQFFQIQTIGKATAGAGYIIGGGGFTTCSTLEIELIGVV